MQRRPLELKALVMRPRWPGSMLLPVLGGGAFGTIAALCAALERGSSWGTWVGVSGALDAFIGGSFIAFMTLLAVMALARGRRLAAKGLLRVTEDGLSLEQLRIARRTIASGSVLPIEDGAVVRLVLRGRLAREIDVHVPSIDDGWRVLEALDLGLGARATRVVATSVRAVWVVLGCFFALIGAGGAMWDTPHPHGVFQALMMVVVMTALALVVPLAARWLRLEVKIGTDGIQTARGPFRSFLPMHRVRGATISDESPSVLCVQRHDGNQLRLDFGGAPWRPLALDEAAIAEESVDEALSWVAASEAPAPPAILAAPPTDDVRAWVAKLRKGTAAEVDYRLAGPTLKDVWAAFEDVRNTAATRAAAAVLLGAAGDSARARLRIEAAATADPPLRVAIERATTDDEAAIAESLAALADAPASRPRRRAKVG